MFLLYFLYKNLESLSAADALKQAHLIVPVSKLAFLIGPPVVISTVRARCAANGLSP